MSALTRFAASISAILALLVCTYWLVGLYFWWAQPPTQDPAINGPSLIFLLSVALLFFGVLWQFWTARSLPLVSAWTLLLVISLSEVAQLVIPYYRIRLGLPAPHSSWQLLLPFLNPVFLITLAGFLLSLTAWLRSRREKARTPTIANF